MGTIRVTIRDIAEAAGVSKSTVANALKDSLQNSNKTRERIKRIAQEMGYRANPLVAAHFANVRRADSSGGFKATLGYLADSPQQEVAKQTHPHYLAYAGARDRASELGFGLDVFCYEAPKLSWSRLRKILQSRNIHGVVFAPHIQSQMSLDFEWDDFSVSMIGGSITYPKYHRVEFDHLSNMEELIGRIKVGDSERVGLALPGAIDDRVRHQFRLAYGVFQEKRKDALAIPIFVSPEWTEAEFSRWYEEYEPEVIVTVFDDVRRWLRSMGKGVPEDVRLYTPVTMEDALDYTGFYLPLEMLGRAAVDSVTGQLFRNERGLPGSRYITMIMGDWRDGITA